eukprot:926304-Rhodomonas_salina.1
MPLPGTAVVSEYRQSDAVQSVLPVLYSATAYKMSGIGILAYLHTQHSVLTKCTKMHYSVLTERTRMDNQYEAFAPPRPNCKMQWYNSPLLYYAPAVPHRIPGNEASSHTRCCGISYAGLGASYAVLSRFVCVVPGT